MIAIAGLVLSLAPEADFCPGQKEGRPPPIAFSAIGSGAAVAHDSTWTCTGAPGLSVVPGTMTRYWR